MSGPLVQARRVPLSKAITLLPRVDQVVRTFLQPMKVGIVQTQMIDGYSQETIIYRLTQASRQPLAESLAVRKDGDRSWRWHVIHMTSDQILNTDDVIILGETRYRIMQKTDWSEYGYCEYHAIEAYKPEGLQ